MLHLLIHARKQVTWSLACVVMGPCHVALNYWNCINFFFLLTNYKHWAIGSVPLMSSWPAHSNAMNSALWGSIFVHDMTLKHYFGNRCDIYALWITNPHNTYDWLACALCAHKCNLGPRKPTVHIPHLGVPSWSRLRHTSCISMLCLHKQNELSNWIWGYLLFYLNMIFSGLETSNIDRCLKPVR